MFLLSSSIRNGDKKVKELKKVYQPSDATLKRRLTPGEIAQLRKKYIFGWESDDFDQRTA